MSDQPNPHSSKIPALDGVRGLAIFMVMVSHFIFLGWPKTQLYYLLQSGWLGVDLFFVLSGFLITGILADSRSRPNYFSNFYRRRVLRIFPLYFLVIAVVWLVVVLLERAPERLHGWDSWGWYLTFTSNIAMAFKGNWTWHSDFLDANHLWSICVEEQFYVLWPLVVWLLPNRILLIVCILLVHFSLPLRHLTDTQFGQNFSLAAYMLPYCRMDGLAVGSFLAVLFRLDLPAKLNAASQQFLKIQNLDRWLVRGLFGWMLVRVVHDIWFGHTQFFGTLSAVMFGAWVYLALSPEPSGWIRRFCEMEWLRHLGKYSYALYVFHHLPHPLWERFWEKPLLASGINPFAAQGIYMVLAFGMTYGLARLSWRFVEEPFLKMKH